MDSNNSNSEKSNKRIRVACDNCRRKKIKCNGQYPCGNCQQSNSSGTGCNYKERQDKRTKPSKVPKRVSNAKTIEILDTRLSKLENVILNLAEKLDPNSINNKNEKLSIKRVEESEYKDESDESTSIEYGDEEDDDDEDDYENLGDENARNQENNSGNNDKEKCNSKKLNFTPQRLEQFFGTHSVVCILSDKSLEWIESTLRPEDSRLINPIRNLPFVFYMKTKSFILKWVDPPLVDAPKKRKLLEKPLPDNYKLVFDFIENYHDPHSTASFVCDFDWVKELFETYYGINGRTRRRFKCSELLIMSMILCLCISCKIDEDTSNLNMSPASNCSTNTPATIQPMSNDELTILQEELLDNSIFYYHRILVINDGLETIQAILLLVIYIESSWITSHVNYILISVAIRFAQEIGLHRHESYDNLSEQEIKTRRMIWWCCYCFDMEICFRSGKPPLINGLDVSTHSEKEVGAMFFPDLLNDEGKDNTMNEEKFKSLDRREEFTLYFQYYMLLLTRIRAKSYNSLFVASAETESFESLLMILETLNAETLKLADSMDPMMRPRFYNDPEFHNIYRFFDTPNTKNILTIHFSYFSHLMVINRIPFLIGMPHTNNCEKGLSLRNLFLDSTRTILVLAKNMPRENIGLSFYNWVIFFPATAFLSLLAACINHPEAPETYNDVKLLADCSMNFFSHKTTWPVEGFSRFKVYQSKDAVVNLIVKLLLNIVIRVFETRTGMMILESNQALKEHLESAEKQFPDIFKDSHKFNSQFKSMLSESFGTQGFVKINGASPFASMKCFDKSPTSVSSQGSSRYYSHQESSMNVRDGKHNYEASNNLSPDLSNILHPNNNTRDSFMNEDLLSDYINDDGLTSMIYSQMNNLPNFFFDNNLGI